jgi:hypothetical protein
METMIVGFFLGIIGFGFFTYGRKQQAPVPLCVGIALFVIPYFIKNLTLLIIVGIGLILLPILLRNRF